MVVGIGGAADVGTAGGGGGGGEAGTEKGIDVEEEDAVAVGREGIFVGTGGALVGSGGASFEIELFFWCDFPTGLLDGTWGVESFPLEGLLFGIDGT